MKSSKLKIMMARSSRWSEPTTMGSIIFVSGATTVEHGTFMAGVALTLRTRKVAVGWPAIEVRTARSATPLSSRMASYSMLLAGMIPARKAYTVKAHPYTVPNAGANIQQPLTLVAAGGSSIKRGSRATLTWQRSTRSSLTVRPAA